MSDKTEEPTPRRLQKALEQGDIPRSAALASAIAFLAALALLPGALFAARAEFEAMVRSALVPGAAWSPMDLARTVLSLTMPLLAGVALTAAVASLVQTKGVIAPVRMAPDLARLDPITGIGRLFAPERWWSVLRALVAATAVAYIGARLLVEHAADLAAALSGTKAEGTATVATFVVARVLRGAAFVGLALGVVDLAVVWRVRRSRLRMTKAEVKREYRENEGDPHLKGARRRAYEDMLAASMINAVRDATVVIVNPEHLATALSYQDGEDEAPRVVASGDGELAKQIQEAARAYGVPVVRDVPVARALAELQVGDEIPPALYEAVAALLREVWDEEEREKRGAAAE